MGAKLVSDAKYDLGDELCNLVDDDDVLATVTFCGGDTKW